MANNRLYLIDPVTRERFCLAKSFGDGWCAQGNHDTFGHRLSEWLDQRDLAAAYGAGHGETVLMVLDENHWRGSPETETGNNS